MSSIPRHLDPKFPQAQRQPSRDSLRSLARSHMSQASDGYYYPDGGDGGGGAAEDFQRLPSSPARLDIDLPESNLDLTIDFNSILAESAPKEPQSAAEMDKVSKRASNVMRLTEQNERLKAELRAMTERLEAAERRQQELAQAQAQRQGGGGQRQGAAGEGAGSSGSAH
ncbi:hypothetical protein C8Q77DRAFT_1154816 [Trametes polyzona]|nr:hypothetical protein C8Q77DRAFT_1154816 [Trametes polyzona]